MSSVMFWVRFQQNFLLVLSIAVNNDTGYYMPNSSSVELYMRSVKVCVSPKNGVVKYRRSKRGVL